MNTQDYLNALLAWLQLHGLHLALIVVLTVVALAVAALVNKKLFGAWFRNKEDADAQKVGETVVKAIHWVVSIVIIAIAVSLILSELGVNMDLVFQTALRWFLRNGLGIAIILALAFVGLKIASVVSGRLILLLQKGKLDGEAQKRADTLSAVIRWVLQTAIVAVAAVMVLGQLGVQIGPVIAAAGVVGLAIGFGAQSLVADVISGFFILLEDQVRVGDVVSLDGRGGLVERITLRMIVLRDFSGSVHFVRNGKIDVVTNMTKDFSQYVFDIGVSYREDVDEVTAVMKSVGEDLQNDPEYKDDILAPVEVVGLDKFADSAVVIKARIKTKPIKQWRVGREFNRRLKKKFDELDIEIPFPHVTLYPGKDKKGDSPALKLEVQGSDQPLAS